MAFCSNRLQRLYLPRREAALTICTRWGFVVTGWMLLGHSQLVCAWETVLKLTARITAAITQKKKKNTGYKSINRYKCINQDINLE